MTTGCTAPPAQTPSESDSASRNGCPAVPGAHTTANAVRSAYDRATLAQKPVLYLDLIPGTATAITDLVACHPSGTWAPAQSVTSSVALPDGEPAPVFDGTQSVTVPSSSNLSIPHTGNLTVQAWIRPSTLTFSHTEGSGYVEWLGKGRRGAFEYAMRMYSTGNTEQRANRTSGYAFNLSGGKGSGSYFQDPLTPSMWIMVTVVFTLSGSGNYPPASVTILRNGHIRQLTSLNQFRVTPEAGSASFSVGTLDGRSFFQGAIAKVAVFDRALPAETVAMQYRTMTGDR